MSGGHVVLVGAGHANLRLVRWGRRLRRAGLAVTLVDPDAFWYSGMASAVAGGVVAAARDRVDPAPLAARTGVEVVLGHVTQLEPDDDGVDVTVRSVSHAGGGRADRLLRASAVVVNVGSEVRTDAVADERSGGRPQVVPAKPTTGLVVLRDALRDGPVGPRVVVVGDGASAVELACNLARGPVGRTAGAQVAVVAAGPLVAVVGEDVRAHLRSRLAALGVAVLRGQRAAAVVDGGVRLADGTVLPADHVVLATGLRAAPLVRSTGLGDDRGMPVTATLQHPAHPRLLGAGDCVRFGDDGLPWLGVHAVRQAPVLRDNVVALHTGRPLRPYEPRDRHVAAVDLAVDDAVLLYGRRWVAGRGALLAKRVLDEWFLRRHRPGLGGPR